MQTDTRTDATETIATPHWRAATKITLSCKCGIEGTVMGEEQLMNGRQWLCTAAASLCIISCIVSLFTIALIAVNRYLYVCWHDAYNVVFTGPRSAVAVVSTWVAGLLLDSPNHLGWSSHKFDTKTQKCLWDRSTAYHYIVLFIVVGMLLPFLVTFICYWRIFTHIQLAKQRLLRTKFQVRLKNNRLRDNSVGFANTINKK